MKSLVHIHMHYAANFLSMTIFSDFYELSEDCLSIKVGSCDKNLPMSWIIGEEKKIRFLIHPKTEAMKMAAATDHTLLGKKLTTLT